ncbi:unnamed protein product [Bursaphelenchus xylophilus]|uniref:(pine wood nematode) hypothetical protein n=1 Tax=Bursaphelenchus xylophilus TaxID=6326 RepID=A0A1I7SC38_BURXY|nr:unnamed protein product [Bursaphelenchus xylophilus]CAG9086485.1 unnamed protein product [Bursaphelenchus xylophilus]
MVIIMDDVRESIKGREQEIEERHSDPIGVKIGGLETGCKSSKILMEAVTIAIDTSTSEHSNPLISSRIPSFDWRATPSQSMPINS